MGSEVFQVLVGDFLLAGVLFFLFAYVAQLSRGLHGVVTWGAAHFTYTLGATLLDAVAPALAVERVGVEIADQPGPEHRDRVAVHDPPRRYVYMCQGSRSHTASLASNARILAGLAMKSRSRTFAPTPAASSKSQKPPSNQTSPGCPP